ncbi:MAG: rod shape-determining protein [Clostridiales bacterium]|nr:rod shape-determining protein [Clostridiales bacterium]
MAGISFGNLIAADLGSAYTYVMTDEKTPVSRCRSVVLVDAHKSSDVYAVGDDAARMSGRGGQDTLVVSPISYGAVGDSELAAILLLSAVEKCAGHRRSLEKSRLVLTSPDGATRVERAALANAALLAGAKKAVIIKAPVASALCMQRKIDRPQAQLVVSIGASVTEVSVISSYAVTLSRHMKTGSSAFDSAIIDYVRKKYSLLLSREVAGELKEQLGCATEPDNDASHTLYGRNIITGRPVSANVSARDVYEALMRPLEELVGMISDALYNIPVEYSEDILKNGISLTGGGSELFGLADRLKNDTQLDVYQSGEPRYDAVRGALAAAGDERLLRRLENAYSAYEV